MMNATRDWDLGFGMGGCATARRSIDLCVDHPTAGRAVPRQSSSIGKGRSAAAAAAAVAVAAAAAVSRPLPSAPAAPSSTARLLQSSGSSDSSSDSSSGSSSGSGARQRRGVASRRDAWQAGARTVGLWSLALGLAPAAARAADAVCMWASSLLDDGGKPFFFEPINLITPPNQAADGAPAAAAKVWLSGKSEKPRGSKDRAGTKRDSSYLRCLSDCTTECRKPGKGLSKDTNECLELCQDYCCQTYEQCTYLLQPE